MHRLNAFVSAVGVLLVVVQPVCAEPPESAHIDVANSHGIGGACYLNSLGQLISYRNPSLTTADVVARSGIATSVGWGRWPGGGLAAHPRGYTQGVEIDLCRLCGVSYRVGYGKGGACGSMALKGASGVTIFKDEAEAVTALKEQIAAGNPVQVHIDMYYTWEAVAAAYPSHDFGPAAHGSHSEAVNGYDADFVYMTDSGLTYGPGETGENIPVPWADFLTAWRETPRLSPIRAFWFGPYFMRYLTNDPVDVDDDWVIAWLGLDAPRRVGDLIVGPDAFRYAADAIRGGRAVESVAPGFSAGVLTQSREFLPAYFTAAGRADLAGLYGDSAALLRSIIEDPDPEPSDVAEKLDQAADLEESAIGLMQAVAAGVEPVVALAPADSTHLRRLDVMEFQWLYLPQVKNPAVQLAMTGDFADRRAVRTMKPRNGNWFVQVTAKDWRTLVAKDGGDRSLRWRVLGTGPEGQITSQAMTLTWDEQVCEAVAPADGYAAAADEVVRFEWRAPPVAVRPRLAISTTGDFTDRKTTVYLAPKRGESAVSFKSGTRALLLKKDDGDGIVYWRIEDAGARLSTVTPSETRTLTLP